MLGGLFHVARPEDWTGVLARLVVAITFVLLAVAILLAELPSAWVALAGGRTWVVRAALVLGTIVALGVVQRVLDARLPRSVVILGRSVRFHDGTRRRAVPIEAIAALHVEQRAPPQREVFVLEELDGAEHDLCPTRWTGAPALHRVLERRVAAMGRRRRREVARAQRQGAG
ncbi:hypothetical protein [Paraliomyxa miuraensis]|uniref:hypothetical protein n=1 Tax=Paraliomyxa miuraensis TaxID=376150 RepID=UPI00224D5E30|nr:hypothetical protein [Paraliomyxa miuraensis]MCX4244634.1 hypothetical protein [Paraliomyxa miuraensis]